MSEHKLNAIEKERQYEEFKKKKADERLEIVIMRASL